MPINPVIHVLMLANVRFINCECQTKQIAIDVVAESCGYPEIVRLAATELLKTHNNSFGEATTAFYYKLAGRTNVSTQAA